jgi:hypothetical protein
LRTVDFLKRSSAAGVCALALAGAPAALPTAAETRPPAAPREIRPLVLPAAGRRTAVVEIDEPGRYAVTAKSAQGTAIQLVDRMAGPGETAGATGERDGRIDRLLDRGRYQLVTLGPEQGTGEVRVQVQPFRERSAPRAPLLVELKPVADTLADLEQRSYWLEAREAKRVVLEAAGRNLADLRLWKEGGWLVDLPTSCETIEPAVGKPLRACRIVARLDPGLYLLTAYGGSGEPWAAGGEEHPFHLRYGIPTLGEAGRQRHVAGPFGADHYLVPQSANYLRLELPEAAAARLEERPFPPDADPFVEARAAAEITKQNREPFAELFAEPVNQNVRLVTVRAPAGSPYVLQHFELSETYTFRRSGRYWLSSVHTGHPQDTVDATAVTIPTETGGRRRIDPALSQAVELGLERGWARRCNLLEPLGVILAVRDTATYEVLARGAEARARIVPLFVTRPKDFREPAWSGNGSRWKLEAGYYELQAEPVQPGVVELAVRPQGKLDRIFDLLDKDRPLKGEPVRPALLFPAVTLDWGRSYELRFGRQPGVRRGLVLRPLPVDLAQPLPLASRPGEEIAIAATVAEAGVLRAETEAGALLEVAVDKRGWEQAAKLTGGEHAVRVRNPGAETVLSSLRFEPARLQPDTPLPPLPDKALPPPIPFPVLTAGEPRSLDLARGASATFAVRVEAPAFHLLESTGLLATEGNVRTRLVPTLARDAGNGSGRNFAVGQYLAAGEYQLTVTALGASQGHLGLRLQRSPLRDGGPLRAGESARVTVAPGEGVVHEFRIDEAGTYHLTAAALGRTIACRLEDADGWPLEPPGVPAELTRRFEPGRYRLVLLPEPVASRRVTTLARIPEPARREGHGPHRLPLDESVRHRWVEAAEGAARTPDRWEFTLPARAEVAVTLTGEMQGALLRRGSAADPVARVPPGRGWSGTLEAGEYALDAVCSRVSNQVEYDVALRPRELVAGLTRAVAAPAVIPVSVGRDGMHEFSTAGSADVRARLLTAAGALIAEQEDRPDDWNVQLAARLTPGAYRLEVLPVGAEAASTTVTMREREEHEAPPLALPGTAELHPDGTVTLVPLILPAEGRVLVLRLAAEAAIGAALEREVPTGWESLWTAAGRSPGVEIPVAAPERKKPPARYRLRLWSLDGAGGPVSLQAATVTPQRATEKELGDGLWPARDPAGGARVVLLEVAPDRPGLFRLPPHLARRVSTAENRPLEPAGERPVPVSGPTFWLAADVPPDAEQAAFSGHRFTPDHREPFALELPPAPAPVFCDLDEAWGGVRLLTVTGSAGLPAVAIVPRADARKPPPGELATATAGSAAAAVALDAEPATAVIRQGAAGAGSTPYVARSYRFAVEDRPRLAGAAAAGAFAPDRPGARQLALPGGAQRVRLALGEGLLAAFSVGKRVTSTHWAAGSPLVETLETEADTLTILDPDDAAAAWSLELLPLARAQRTPALAAGAPFSRRPRAAGTVRLPVTAAESAAPPYLLHVRGAAADPTLLGSDGRIAQGVDLEAGSGGVLLIPHGTALVTAWLDRPGEAVPGLWGAKAPDDHRDLDPPEAFALEGKAVALRITARAATVLHLRTDEPVLTVVKRPDGGAEAAIHGDGARLDLLLPAGPAEVWLRAADGGELRGRAEATTSTPAVIGEGLGPEVLLAPGAARFFTFTVERAGPVGIGVRAVPAGIEAFTLDAAGRAVASGVVQMPDLKPGTYLLGLRAPADGGAVSARPALAGVVPPGLGPPEGVLRRYLQLEETAEPVDPTPEGQGDTPATGEEHGD